MTRNERLFVERILPIAVLAFTVVCVPFQILGPEGLPRMRSLQLELESVEQENAELARDIGRLRLEIRELKDDPAAVEKIARQRLGLVRRNEIVFQLGARSPGALSRRESGTVKP